MDTKYANNLLSKLANFAKTCGAGLAHDVNVQYAVLQGYIRAVECGRFPYSYLEEAVTDAEKFLAKVAG